MNVFILFVLGLIVGSFLNVVGLRLNSGISIGGRSFCYSCGHRLKWWELVPLFSFLFLQGRCSECRAKISWQYPLVELWTGLIFVTVPIAYLAVFCLYVAITIYDFRHKIIPDLFVYLSIALALVLRVTYGGGLLDWLAGPILFAFFATIWAVSSGRAMGFGDAKLGLSVGLLLGAAAGFSAIILSFWIGALFGIAYMFLSHYSPLLSKGKRITMKSEVPFAPFIILASWLSLIFHLDLLHVTLF